FSHKRGIIYQVRRGEDNMSLKTNAARESDLSAISVAQKVGLPIEQVYKTLVAQGDKTGVIVACIQGDHDIPSSSTRSLKTMRKLLLVQVYAGFSSS
ncbi:MAG TPA: Cys-tRNA(Pro) deacylase, partial [Desulfosporosinus sp.]|nr:Cys-tRNA(Pro) deacylase [Desulfosporosinus sp.]